MSPPLLDYKRVAVERLDPATPPRRLRRWLRILGESPDCVEIGVSPAAMIWVASLIEKRQLLPPDVIDTVLEEAATQLMQEIESRLNMLRSDEKTIPTCLLAIHDWTFVTWSGCQRFFDIRTNQHVSALPSYPVETVSYNLLALLQLHLSRLQKSDHENRHVNHASAQSG